MELSTPSPSLILLSTALEKRLEDWYDTGRRKSFWGTCPLGVRQQRFWQSHFWRELCRGQANWALYGCGNVLCLSSNTGVTSHLQSRQLLNSQNVTAATQELTLNSDLVLIHLDLKDQTGLQVTVLAKACPTNSCSRDSPICDDCLCSVSLHKVFKLTPKLLEIAW